MILSQTFYTEMIKLPASNKNKITKVENSENVSHLEITEVILVHLILSTTIISKTQEYCIHFFLINCLINY